MGRKRKTKNKTNKPSESSGRTLRNGKKLDENINVWVEKDVSKTPESPSFAGQTNEKGKRKSKKELINSPNTAQSSTSKLSNCQNEVDSADSLNSTFSPDEPKYSAQYLNSQNITSDFNFSTKSKNLTPFYFRGSSQISKEKIKPQRLASIKAFEKREKENCIVETKKRKLDESNELLHKSKRSRVTFEDNKYKIKSSDRKVQSSLKHNRTILKSNNSSLSLRVKTPLNEKNIVSKTNIKSSLKKVPDFSSIHKKMFDQMLSIDDLQHKKSERSKKLFFASPKPTPFNPVVKEPTTNDKMSSKRISRSHFGFKFVDKNKRREAIKKEVLEKQKPSTSDGRLKEYVKGVRTNRRFELMMMKRKNN